ncbi:MAG: AI-2E family transporter [Lachnospiraceae bacterium]|nr:AI-2E family transporter [Lachnospiraceae bacterium]
MKEKKQVIRIVLSIITFTVVLVYIVNHTSMIAGIFGKIVSMLVPFLLGGAIAFVINIPMKSIEDKFFKDETKGIYKYKRAISMIVAYILAFLVVGLVVFVVVPELAATVTKIKDKLPEMFDKGRAIFIKYTEKYPSIKKEIQEINVNWNEVGNIFKNNSSTIIGKTVSVFSSIISAITNTLVGIVFSAYILSQKEHLAKQFKMIIYALFKENTADEMMVFGKIANSTFSKFFACQFREGIILGSMFMVAMGILRMPFVLTIGVLIAFTALIPVFGAFIGLLIAIFLLLVEAPNMVVWFIVLFFVLQFIENYFIYPKLVGGDIGLSAIWVLLAVIVGGDLMGVIGMFVFIPLVSVFYAYGRSIVYRKLKKKSINVEDKQAPEDVAPLMEGRRRLFTPKNKTGKSSTANKASTKKDENYTGNNKISSEKQTPVEDTKKGGNGNV